MSSIEDTARLFALLGMGIADAVVATWRDKYNYHFWRPGDAIRNAGSDLNPNTNEDAMWNPRSGACTDPPTCTSFGGTPEHTSGTSCFAGAASMILAGFYCRDDIVFSFQGELGTPPRRYEGFKEAARQAGRSRIFGGIHFQFSNDKGREAGKDLAKEILRTRLLPAGPCHDRKCPCVPD